LILSPFEWTIAKRYMLPGRGEAFIALVAGISLVAVMLGVAALVIVMRVARQTPQRRLSEDVGACAEEMLVAGARQPWEAATAKRNRRRKPTRARGGADISTRPPDVTMSKRA
jgi:lipoprotein-releasing system permease protein